MASFVILCIAFFFLDTLVYYYKKPEKIRKQKLKECKAV